MKVTVKKLKCIDIETLIEKYDLEIIIEQQEPAPNRMCEFRGYLKGVSERNPRMAISHQSQHWCDDPEDIDSLLVDIAHSLNWKVITLPSGIEIGPFFVTTKRESNKL